SFILLLPRPPRPTLFPYTTLFRSSIGVDRTGGANNGRVYVSFVDQADADGDNDRGNKVDHDNTDVYVISSSDGGTTWGPRVRVKDRKSTRLNSSHVKNSYAVFCLK